MATSGLVAAHLAAAARPRRRPGRRPRTLRPRASRRAPRAGAPSPRRSRRARDLRSNPRAVAGGLSIVTGGRPGLDPVDQPAQPAAPADLRTAARRRPRPRRRACRCRRLAVDRLAPAASACLTMFVSASQATKYAVASTSAAAAGPRRSRRARPGVCARFVSDSSAAASPSSVRIAGWTPWASSRSSSHGALQLDDGGVQRDARPRGRRARASRCCSARSSKRQRDQPLLRAVVEIALDPAPLLVARSDDARPRLLYLHELARVSACRRAFSSAKSRRRAGRLDEPRLLSQGRIVDDGGERLSLVLEAASPRASSRQPEEYADSRRSRRTCPARAARTRARASGRRGRGPAHRRILAGGVSLELEHEIADAGSGQSRTQKAGEQRERQRDERSRSATRRRTSRAKVWSTNVDTPSKTARRAMAIAASSKGRENATHPRRGSDQPAGEQRDEARTQNEVEDDDERLLEHLDDIRIGGDHDQALGRQTEAD